MMKSVQICCLSFIAVVGLGVASPATAQTVINFNYTGTSQLFSVPAGVSLITLEVWGGQGASNAGGVLGGLGGYVKADLPVSLGQSLYIYVGGGGGIATTGLFNGGGNAGAQPAAGAAGGAGGGASDVRLNGFALTDRIVVAGGGGGAGGNRVNTLGRGSGGGGGGGYYGGGGGAGWPYTSNILPTGGTQSSGGTGGNSDWTIPVNNDGLAGGFGFGGAGGDEVTSNQAGSGTGPTGGAGGGLTGGSGLFTNDFTGQSGAGGSSFLGAGLTNTTNLSGVNSGNGLVRFTFAVVPEPGSIWLATIGGGLMTFRRRRSRSANAPSR